MKDAASTTCRSYFNNGTDIQNRGNAPPPPPPPRPTSLLLLHCRWYYCWTNRCAMGRENYCIKKKAAMVRRDCCSLPIGNIDMLLADVQMKAGLYQLQWSNSLFDASSCSSAIKQWPSSFLHSICCFRFLKPINSSVASTWVTSRSRFLFFFFSFQLNCSVQFKFQLFKMKVESKVGLLQDSNIWTIWLIFLKNPFSTYVHSHLFFVILNITRPFKLIDPSLVLIGLH